MTKNRGVLEVAHISAENTSQMYDPKNINLYQQKEVNEAEALKPTLKFEDGSFRQKEKFKFKDFSKHSESIILKQRKDAIKKEKMHMDGLIAAHLLK